MNYVITDTNKEKGWVALTVTFDDKTTYNKRMMVPMESEESIHGAIMKWLAQYIEDRQLESTYDPSPLKGKAITFTEKDLTQAKEV